MKLITCAQLACANPLLGGQTRFDQELPPEQPILRARQHCVSAQDGLVLYLSQSEDLLGMCSENLLLPGIKATFVVDGQTELSYGAQRACLAPGSAVLVNLAEPDRFQRYWSQGRREAKVSLTLTRSWLERMVNDSSFCWRELERFSRAHLETRPWQPSAALRERARQLFDSSHDDPLLERLQHESFAIDLAIEVIGGVRQAPVLSQLSAPLQRRMARLKALLDSGAADGLSLAQIARQLGTNPVDMQHYFRRLHGTTIVAYLRAQRLGGAHKALCEQAVSIEEAAALAGYASATSFSTAFRRQYGIPPSHVRTLASR